MRVTDAAERLGVSVSTAHRLLGMLVYRDFAEQLPDRRYGPGRLMQHGSAPQAPVARLREVALPYLHGLVDELRETVNLMVLAGAEVRFVATVESDQVLRVGDRTGRALPVHLSSGGKALLAARPAADVAALVVDLDEAAAGRLARELRTVAPPGVRGQRPGDRGRADRGRRRRTRTRQDRRQPLSRSPCPASGTRRNACPSGVPPCRPPRSRSAARWPADVGSRWSGADRLGGRPEEALELHGWGAVVDRDDAPRRDGVGPGEQGGALVERAVEHGGFALRVEVADHLDVETELLGPAVLRRPVGRGVPVQQRADRGAGLVDGVGPVRGAGQFPVAVRRSR